MTVLVSHTTIDCHDAYVLSEWWKQLLGYTDIPGDPNEPGDKECMIIDPDTAHRLGSHGNRPSAAIRPTYCTETPWILAAP